MNAYWVETTLTENGELALKNLPFGAGASVEVIVLEKSDNGASSDPNPLRGSVLRYDNPFEPAVPIEDWECLG